MDEVQTTEGARNRRRGNGVRMGRKYASEAKTGGWGTFEDSGFNNLCMVVPFTEMEKIVKRMDGWLDE